MLRSSPKLYLSIKSPAKYFTSFINSAPSANFEIEFTDPLRPSEKLSPKYLDRVNIDNPLETFQFSSTAKYSSNLVFSSASKSTAFIPNVNCQGLLLS